MISNQTFLVHVKPLHMGNCYAKLYTNYCWYLGNNSLRNSEVFALEFLEKMFLLYYLCSDVYSRFKYSSPLYWAIRIEGVLVYHEAMCCWGVTIYYEWSSFKTWFTTVQPWYCFGKIRYFRLYSMVLCS